MAPRPCSAASLHCRLAVPRPCRHRVGNRRIVSPHRPAHTRSPPRVVRRAPPDRRLAPSLYSDTSAAAFLQSGAAAMVSAGGRTFFSVAIGTIRPPGRPPRDGLAVAAPPRPSQPVPTNPGCSQLCARIWVADPRPERPQSWHTAHGSVRVTGAPRARTASRPAPAGSGSARRPPRALSPAGCWPSSCRCRWHPWGTSGSVP